MWRRRQAARFVESRDIFPVRRPDGFALAPFGKEAQPSDNIASVPTQAVQRAHPHGWTGAKEPIEVVIVAAIIAKDEWHAVDEAEGRCRGDDLGRKFMTNAIDEGGTAECS